MMIKRSRNHSPVLLVIPTNWSRDERELVTQLFFEKFNVPGMHIADYSLMSLYGYGQHLTGIVILLNEDRVVFSPVIETLVQDHAVVNLPLGAIRVRQELKGLLEKDAQFKTEYGKPVDEELLNHLLIVACSVKPIVVDPTKQPTRKHISFKGKDVRIVKSSRYLL